MKQSVLRPALVLLLAVLACNAPTSPPTSLTIETPTEVSSIAVSQIPTSPPTFELPDIAGTANAQASTTPDPNQQAKIRGTIRYPSEGNPPMRVYALAVNGQTFQFVTTVVNQGSYEITVPPGEYYVLADLEDNSGFEAGYTAVVQCLVQNELKQDACPDQDHSLIAVHIQPGQTLDQIDLIDWFPPEGSFPPVP